jgi:hypothetical protein
MELRDEETFTHSGRKGGVRRRWQRAHACVGRLNTRMQEMVRAWPQQPQRLHPGEMAQALGID